MKIGVAIDGQFMRRTGIQYYVDSLLGALYALDSAHEIRRLRAHPLVTNGLAASEDGRLLCLASHPGARVDTAGNDLQSWVPILVSHVRRAAAGRNSPTRGSSIRSNFIRMRCGRAEPAGAL